MNKMKTICQVYKWCRMVLYFLGKSNKKSQKKSPLGLNLRQLLQRLIQANSLKQVAPLLKESKSQENLI